MTQSPTDKITADLANELRENMARLRRYVASLESLLIGLQDADPFGLPDWDWQWPQHDRLELSLNIWSDKKKINQSTAPEAKLLIKVVYDICASMPPRLETWIDGWDGNPNVLTAYLVKKLKDYESTALSKAQEAEAALGVASSSSHPGMPASTSDPAENGSLENREDYSGVVFLAGAGRSGTTWVSDIINYDNQYRYMWEPFNGRFVPICERFISTLYLRPQQRDAELLDITRAILAGQIRNSWIDRFNRSEVSAKRLIKECRANLWLMWLRLNFPTIPIFLLMRHPCAVVSSRLSLDWPSYLGQFLAQEELMQDYLEPFRAAIERADTPFERHVFAWCIQHYVPLRQFRPEQIYLIFYESLWTEPKAELTRLFSFLGKQFDYRAYVSLLRPSPMSRGGSAIVQSRSASIIESWRKRLTKDEVQRALGILKLFGLDKIYCEELLPNIQGAHDFMLQ